jgi:hypothetical protein
MSWVKGQTYLTGFLYFDKSGKGRSTMLDKPINLTKMKEPIVMYVFGEPRIVPPYRYPLFLNTMHLFGITIVPEQTYKEMEELSIKKVGVFSERFTIAKWKIFLK